VAKVRKIAFRAVKYPKKYCHSPGLFVMELNRKIFNPVCNILPNNIGCNFFLFNFARGNDE